MSFSGLIECPTCGCSYPPGTELCPMDGTRLSVSPDEMPTIDDPLILSTLDGRYEVLEMVGRGGMGSVYRAHQKNVGRDVAVKVVNAFVLQDEGLLRRFENEARIISALRHPNTLKLIDFGKTKDGRPYLVTEFLIGRPLERILKQGPVDVYWILRIMRQVVDALTEAHSAGIVHRDLKPDNVFIEHMSGDDIVRVLDFGIAKLGQQSNTATGTLFGTPTYMSPEQARGDPADARSDLYSVGVMLYRAISGRPPFDGEQPMGILLQHVSSVPTPLAKVSPQVVAPEVERLVMQLLEKSPDDRPSSALILKQQIDQLLGAAPSSDVQRPYPTPAPNVAFGKPEPAGQTAAFNTDGLGDSIFSDVKGRSKLVVGATFLAFAIGIIAAAFYIQSGDTPSTPTVVEPLEAPVIQAPPAPPPPVVEPPPPPPATVKAPPTRPKKSTTPRKKKKTTKKRRKKAPEGTAKPPPDEEETPEGFVDFDVE